jgi:hypothetical protein
MLTGCRLRFACLGVVHLDHGRRVRRDRHVRFRERRL